MYIETKKTGLTIGELIEAIPEVRKDSGDIFPYTKEVCQCRYCAYCQKGKCSLKQCCCMDDRIKAHNCTISEVLRYCFSNIGDNIFLYRLRIAAERAGEQKSVFMNAEHRDRFKRACATTRNRDGRLLAQLYLLSAGEGLWERIVPALADGRIEYYAIHIGDMTVEEYTLYSVAMDLQFGTNRTEIEDLSNDEVVEFSLFRVICYAMAIAAFGYDVIRIAEKKPKHKKNRHRNGVNRNE